MVHVAPLQTARAIACPAGPATFVDGAAVDASAWGEDRKHLHYEYTTALIIYFGFKTHARTLEKQSVFIDLFWQQSTIRLHQLAGPTDPIMHF